MGVRRNDSPLSLLIRSNIMLISIDPSPERKFVTHKVRQVYFNGFYFFSSFEVKKCPVAILEVTVHWNS